MAGTPGDPATSAGDAKLNVVTPAGAVAQVLGEGGAGDYGLPHWRPHMAELSYVLDDRLVVSSIGGNASSVQLGPPRTRVTHPSVHFGHTWSPSGRWVAVRYGADARTAQSDNLYLVDADRPGTTVEVVATDAIHRQMTDALWSPDGKTLIVFDAGSTQPYALDVGTFLASEGLQP